MDGAWAQAIRLAFRFLFAAIGVLALAWTGSNLRLVPPDARAAVLRLGTVARIAGPGLLLAWPRPFEEVVLLPGADRQIEQPVRRFGGTPVALTGQPPEFQVSPDVRSNAAFLLTGETGLVHLQATLFYRISDPAAFLLAAAHVPAALDRLFAASAVAVCASRGLNDILVAQPGAGGGATAAASRETFRTDLVRETNRRLDALARQGAGLGVRIDRVDVAVALPGGAKAAFDRILTASQTANAAVAEARTGRCAHRTRRDPAARAHPGRGRRRRRGASRRRHGCRGAGDRPGQPDAWRRRGRPGARPLLPPRGCRAAPGPGGLCGRSAGGGAAAVRSRSRLGPRSKLGPRSGPRSGRPAMSAATLLDRGERRRLGMQLSVALLVGGLLLLNLALRVLAPEQADVASLVAGAAAALIAVPALAAAWHSLRHPDLHGVTDILVALALAAAWAAGELVTAALLPMVMILGHVLEERSLLGSREAIGALGRLSQARVRRLLPSGAEEEVTAAMLHPGERVRLRAGDLVPVDGVVEQGRASLDTASLTGESVPEEVGPGAAVFAGAIDLDGVLTVTVTRTGAATTLGRVVALMRAAERAKPPVSRLLERYAGRYLVLVLLAAAGLWFATGSTPATLALLVASCPCALVLATPATAIAAIAVAARHGILVKGSAFLEHLATVDSLVLDKTGTVTLGALRLVSALPAPGVEARELLAVAAALGAASRHPVSRALAGVAAPPAAAEAVREMQGLGVVGTVSGEAGALGRPALLAELAIPAPPPPPHDGPVAGAARGGRFLGWLLLADEPRPEARQALAELRALGLGRQLLLTGDRAAVAERVSRFLGIGEVRAEVLPAQKLEAVLAQTRAGFRPLVVGDGINDALALRAGAVGVAMGAAGTDVALASADVVLMTSDLRRLGTAIRLSRRCRRTIHVNVGLGLGWTLALVALAATGALGVQGALIAAVLHNAGTLAVIANAGRLLRFDEVDAGQLALPPSHGHGVAPAMALMPRSP